MKPCKHCGGKGVEQEIKQELGHGYWGVNFYIECMSCNSKTEELEWLDIHPVSDWGNLKRLAVKNWEDGLITRSTKADTAYYVKLGKMYEKILKEETQ